MMATIIIMPVDCRFICLPRFELPLSCRIFARAGTSVYAVGRVKLGFLSLASCTRGMGNVRHYLPAFYVFSGADCIQGAKAQQKRERKAQNGPKAKSQSKSNEMAKSIICLVCRQPFVSFFRIFPL